MQYTAGKNRQQLVQRSATGIGMSESNTGKQKSNKIMSMAGSISGSRAVGMNGQPGIANMTDSS